MDGGVEGIELSQHFLKAGAARAESRAKAAARAGMATRKINDSLALMEMAAMLAEMSITGARTKMRMVIIKAFWALVTSVVRRVMREAVLNLSKLAKENSWILWKSRCRSPLAKPVACQGCKPAGQRAEEQSQKTKNDHQAACFRNIDKIL